MKINKCPFCKTELVYNIGNDVFECKTLVRISTNKEVTHFFVVGTKQIVDFYNFAYFIDNSNHYIQTYNKLGCVRRTIEVNPIDINLYSYSELELKLKNLMIFI